MRAANARAIAQSLLWYVPALCAGAMLYLLSVLDTRTLLTFVIAVIGVLPLVRAMINRGSDALSPTVLLPFTYILYALGPLEASMQLSQHVIICYLFLQFWGLLAMRLGLHAATKRRHSPGVHHALDSLADGSKTLLALTFVSVMLLSAVSLVTCLAAFGGLTGYIEVGYGGRFYLILGEAEVIGAGFEWWLLGAVLVSFYGIKRHSKPCLFSGIALFMFAAGIVLLTGRRSQLLYPLLFGLALFHYGHRRFPSPAVTAGILLGISAAQYYALARFFLPGGLTYALSQVWRSVARNPYLVAPWAANEFRMPAASLLEVLHYGGPGLLLGRSYIASLGAPIPFVARLFSQVSFDLNAWRLSTFYPDLLAAGGGLGFSPVTEAYVNFGVIGVFLHLFLYGYIIGKIYNHLLTKPTWPALLLFAGSLPVFMLDGMRVSSASFVWRWGRVYLMPWIIFIVLKALVPRQPRRSRTLSRSEST